MEGGESKKGQVRSSFVSIEALASEDFFLRSARPDSVRFEEIASTSRFDSVRFGLTGVGFDSNRFGKYDSELSDSIHRHTEIRN